MNNPGMSLIEVMVHLLVSTTIITLAGALSLKIRTTVRSHTVTNESLIQLGVALTYFANDIRTEEIFQGKVLNKECCIFASKGKDIGWLIKNNRLMRYVGHYNKTSQRWSHLSTSTIVSSITSLTLNYYYKETILLGINCTLSKKAHEKEITLELFTGIPLAG